MEDPDYNRRIWKLWNDCPDARGEWVPKFVKAPNAKGKGGLLFVGLNPSRLEEVSGDDFCWPKSPRDQEYREYRRDIADKIRNTCHSVRHSAGYFKRLTQLAETLGVAVEDYAHVDLLFWLETNSAKARARMREFPAFAGEQMGISFDLIRAWAPRMIVCSYAGAGDGFQRLCRTKNITFGWRVLRKKLRVACVDLPWSSTQLVPVFRCTGLPGPGPFAKGMSDGEFTEVAQTISRYWRDNLCDTDEAERR